MEINRSELISVLDFVKQCQSAYTTKNMHKLISDFYDLINYNTLMVSLCDLQNNEMRPVFNVHIPQNLRSIKKPRVLTPAKLLQNTNNLKQKNNHKINHSSCLPDSANCSDAGETMMVNDKNISYLCHRPIYGDTATVMYLETKLNQILPRDKYILTYVTSFLHDAITRVASKDKNRPCKFDLTKRQLEILHWGKAGKSNWEIAKILNITERTVKFHFGNIYKNLDVLNRSQAIVKAIEDGILQ